MDNCLRSNILTAVSILLMTHGMANLSIDKLFDMNNTLQGKVDALLAESIKDNKALAQAHQAAIAQFEEKKRQIEAQCAKP